MLILAYFLGISSFLLLVLIFLCSPADRKHPDREILENSYIAHRGLHHLKNGVPENSLSAFKKAIEKNLPIEIDLHLTKDGEVVVFHDDDGKRACGVEKKIEEMTLSEVKSLRLFGTDEQIPNLQECLDLVCGKVFLLIEFKVVDNNTKSLCEAANKILTEYKGKYFIQSFYPQILYWYKKNAPEVCRGQLSATFQKESLAKVILGKQLLNFIGRPDFISFKHQDNASLFFRFAVFLGGFPVGWTFQSKEELKKNKKRFRTFIFENLLNEEEN